MEKVSDEQYRKWPVSVGAPADCRQKHSTRRATLSGSGYRTRMLSRSTWRAEHRWPGYDAELNPAC